MTLEPTHHCFDDALDFLVMRVRLGEDPRSTRLVLVHGVCLLPDDAFRVRDGQPPGTPFAHAWVEEDDRVWVAGLLAGDRTWVPQHRVDFYARLRVQATTRYSIRQAWKANRRFRTYGPWKPAYLALCRNTGRERVTVDAVSDQVKRS